MISCLDFGEPGPRGPRVTWKSHHPRPSRAGFAKKCKNPEGHPPAKETAFTLASLARRANKTGWSVADGQSFATHFFDGGDAFRCHLGSDDTKNFQLHQCLQGENTGVCHPGT